VIGACVLKNDSSSSLRTARSIRSDAHDGRGDLVPGLVGLDLHLARIQHDVRVGQDALAFDDTPEAVTSLGACFVQGLNGSG